MCLAYSPLNIVISPIHGNHWQQVPPYQNLDCLVTGAPGPLDIEWYYMSTPSQLLSTIGRIRVDHVSSSEYDGGLRLVLNSAFPIHDSGVYTCVAKNGWEQVKQTINIDFITDGMYYITVTRHIDWLSIIATTNVYIAYWPVTILAVGSSNVNITCYAVSGDHRLNIDFAFKKDNITLLSQHSNMLNPHVSWSSLLLPNVSQLDNANYSCQLLDIVGSDWSTGTLTVYKGSYLPV